MALTSDAMKCLEKLVLQLISSVVQDAVGPPLVCLLLKQISGRWGGTGTTLHPTTPGHSQHIRRVTVPELHLQYNKTDEAGC